MLLTVVHSDARFKPYSVWVNPSHIALMREVEYNLEHSVGNPKKAMGTKIVLSDTEITVQEEFSVVVKCVTEGRST